MARLLLILIEAALTTGFCGSGALWSSPHNTAVAIPCAPPLTPTKLKLITRVLSTSTFPVTLLADGPAFAARANASSGTRAGAGLGALVSLARANSRGTHLHHQVKPLSYPQLERRFGAKVRKFTGYNQRRPSKLGFFAWCAASAYEHCWHLEDDTAVSDLGAVAAEYEGAADLVARGHDRKPFWWNVQLRVKAPGGADFSRFIGDPAHGLPEGTFNFVNLALCRVSRRFARAVLQAIDTELNTSHHEIYIGRSYRHWYRDGSIALLNRTDFERKLP